MSDVEYTDPDADVEIERLTAENAKLRSLLERAGTFINFQHLEGEPSKLRDQILAEIRAALNEQRP